MKKIKVFYMDKRLKDIYPYATKWEVFKWKCMKFFRRLAVVSIAVAFVTGAYAVGGKMEPVRTVFADREIIKEVPVDNPAPVMERIAKCESGGVQTKNGQVVVHANSNNSVDMGKYQINISVWGKKATEMGLDLSNEKDNTAFAKYLYSQYGTEPWFSSKNCWSK